MWAVGGTLRRSRYIDLSNNPLAPAEGSSKFHAGLALRPWLEPRLPEAFSDDSDDGRFRVEPSFRLTYRPWSTAAHHFLNVPPPAFFFSARDCWAARLAACWACSSVARARCFSASLFRAHSSNARSACWSRSRASWRATSTCLASSAWKRPSVRSARCCCKLARKQSGLTPRGCGILVPFARSKALTSRATDGSAKREVKVGSRTRSTATFGF